MKRVLTALAGIPVALGLTFFAPDWVFALALSIVGALCLEELFSSSDRKMGTRPGRWVLILGAAVTVAFIGGPLWVLGAVAIAVMLVLAGVMTLSVSLETALPKVAIAVMGILYCSFLLGFLIPLPREMRVVLLAAVWVGDAAAYYGGKSFGRHPLAPSISPKKTIEGAFSGLTGSVVAGVLIGVLVSESPPVLLLAASFTAGTVGQIGDLAESALKRSAGVKDSSSVLPGHGGMLDRMDSILFAAPVFYWFFHS